MAEPRVNNELREHVTRVGFDLNLAKTQIAALVWLDIAIERKQPHLRGVPYDSKANLSPIAHMADKWWVMGINGCINRGLVVHKYIERKKDERGHYIGRELPIGRHYQITNAGDLVLELLKEAGIYQDYEKPIRRELIGEDVA